MQHDCCIRNLDVPGIAATLQSSIVVMTDADWAGDVKDCRSYSGIAVWVKGSVEKHVVSRVCVFQETEHGLLEFW